MHTWPSFSYFSWAPSTQPSTESSPIAIIQGEPIRNPIRHLILELVEDVQYDPDFMSPGVHCSYNSPFDSWKTEKLKQRKRLINRQASFGCMSSHNLMRMDTSAHSSHSCTDQSKPEISASAAGQTLDL